MSNNAKNTKRKKLLFLSGNPSWYSCAGSVIEDSNQSLFQNWYELAGRNLGNNLITNSVPSVLANFDNVSQQQFSHPSEVEERCDHIVLVAANWLWKGFDFGGLADLIEATNLPVTIIGLGAQTNDRSTICEIHPNTLRLIRLISEKSKSLGVRGFYTAEVLAANGILNTEVIGCPSLYLSLEPPETIIPLTASDLKHIAVNFSRRVSDHSFSKYNLCAVENALLNIATEYNLPFIAQDELEEVALASNEVSDYQLKSLTNYFHAIDKDKLINYFAANTNYFNEVDSWSRFITDRKGTVGSRFHGNIISLINSKPCFVIAHDSRTLELCVLAGIPHLNIKTINPDTFNEITLIESIQNASYGIFHSNMKLLFKRYRRFLEDHHLSHRLSETD